LFHNFLSSNESYTIFLILQGFEYNQKIEKLIRVSLARNRARPSCTARARPMATQPRPAFMVLAWPMSAAHGHAGVAQLGLGRRSARDARRARRHSARRQRCTAASRRRPHRRMGDGQGNVAGLTEAWTMARHDVVDGGVRWHDGHGRRRHDGSAMTDGELRGWVRGLARSEARDTRGGGRRTHRCSDVDGGIDGSDATEPGERAASDIGAVGSSACVRTAAVRTALSERLLSHPARSDTAAHSSQSGLGAARHCC
jgi:hypothetical protein